MKFEAMINSIINKTVLQLKMPGNKFIVGSSAGFGRLDDIDSVNRSKIIQVGNWDGKELKSYRLKNGKVEKYQVLSPSKFKVNGQTLNLFEGYDKSTKEGKYIKEVDGKFVIKEDMIDPKMLEQFLTRIPTSSHALSASAEIVGFLPPEMGDLIITPKDFVVKMGQDFDINELTGYSYNHIVRENGRIEKLTKKIKVLIFKRKKIFTLSFKRT